MSNNKKILFAGYSDSKMNQAGNWKEIPDTEEARQQALRDGYTSFSTTSFEFNPQNAEGQPCRYGDLYFDIDCKDNFEQAVYDTTILIDYFASCGVSLDSLDLYASGGKGFHLRVPAIVLGAENGAIHLPEHYKKLVIKIKKEIYSTRMQYISGPTLNKTIDMAMYCMGRGRLLRVENIKRENGNYKVPVSIAELQNLSPAELKKLTEQPRQRTWERCLPEKNEHLSTMYDDIAKSESDGNAYYQKKKENVVEAIESNCYFMNHCIKDSTNLSEPEWFTMAKIYKEFGEYGEKVFIENSRNYKNFSEKEANEKFENAKKYGCPSCTQIKEIFSCPQDCHARSPFDTIEPCIIQNHLVRFFLKDDMLYYREFGKSKDGSLFFERPICSYISAERMTRLNDNCSWGILFCIKDHDGKKHDILLSKSETRTPAAITKLEDAGLQLYPPLKYTTDKLTEFLVMSRPAKRGLRTQCNGWNADGLYILGDKAIGKDFDEMVIADHVNPAYSFEQNGTLEEWQEAVARYGNENTWIAFVLFFAFVGPLLKFMNHDCFFVHLYGRSSFGKTTLLTIANSVTGEGGKQRQINTWSMTRNAGECSAALHNDCMMTLDEIGQGDPRHVGALVYDISNGTGKGRAKIDASLQKPKRWLTCVLSTGESTLADKLSEDGRTTIKAGQMVRCIDVDPVISPELGVFDLVPNDIADSAKFAEHLKGMAKTYYGTAFIAFLEKFTDTKDESIEFVKEKYDFFCASEHISNCSGQVIRVMGHFAMIAGAGELAIHLGILPFTEGHALSVCRKIFKEWVDARGGVGDIELENLVERVKKFIFVNKKSRFERVDSQGNIVTDYRVLNPAGYYWKNTATGNEEFLIEPQIFKDEIAKGVNLSDAKAYMKKKNMFALNSNHNIKETKNIEGKNIRGYIFEPENWLKQRVDGKSDTRNAKNINMSCGISDIDTVF